MTRWRPGQQVLAAHAPAEAWLVEPAAAQVADAAEHLVRKPDAIPPPVPPPPSEKGGGTPAAARSLCVKN
jgi:hypothetical protein